MKIKVAVLDDWQHAARDLADWSSLEGRCQVDIYTDPLGDADALAEALQDCEVILAMRERASFPAELVRRLPKLGMFSMGGARASTIAIDQMVAQGVTVCATVGGPSGVATAELALGLMLSLARSIPQGDKSLRAGTFQTGTMPGTVLDGKVLGIVGLGRIGSRMARYGAALGMRVQAWSQNLTEERARECGATYVSKEEIFPTSDAISLHLAMSDRTRHIVGATDLGRMKPGAMLINTARSGLIDSAALVAAVGDRKIRAALDVYDTEPLPRTDPMASLPGSVLTPHLGYCTRESLGEFYRQMIENVHAYLDGAPIRVIEKG